jgi:hypothetical protein
MDGAVPSAEGEIRSARFRYAEAIFAANSVTEPLDFEKIQAQAPMWEFPAETVHMSILANADAKKKKAIATQVVTRKNVFADKRFAREVAEAREALAPSRRGRKKAAEKKKKKDKGWRLFMAIQLPPMRNYSAEVVSREIALGRGWKGRCFKALWFADSMILEAMVTKEVFDETSPLFMKEMVEYTKNAPRGIRVF